MIRGVVEGFYGAPWSHAERLGLLDFCAQVGLDTYLYAPKDDPFHRERWREPYPDSDLAELSELAHAADGTGVRLVVALHPALDMRFADDSEHGALAAKATQLWDAGVRSYALLFDDVPQQLSDPEDVARFGDGAEGAGAAHGTTCARFVTDVLLPRGVSEPLLACPTDYAGTASSPYRDAWARTTPHDVLTCWTGRDVVVGSVTRAEADAAAASYRRRVVLWDNFPVNDFDPSRLFLGPLTGRAADLGAGLAGLIANGMVQAAPSRLAFATVADWLRDPATYRPDASAHAALTRVAGDGADDLAPLVRVCRSWPPSADRDPELTAACDAALDGDRVAAATVVARLTALERCSRHAHEPAELVTALAPWLASAVALARAGLLAVELLADPGPALWNRCRAALDIAEDRYPDVLRTVVPPFVRSVLDRTVPISPVGDRFTAELAGRLNLAARPVVVTPSTPPQTAIELAHQPVPILAWGRYAELGLADSQQVLLSRTGLRIADPDDTVAAGFDAEVRAYRGPGRMTVGTVGEHARVIARDATDGDPAVFRYEPGDPLVSGNPAPGRRIGLFLGPDGPAPWLLSGAGRAIVVAALEALDAGQTAST